MSYRKCGDGSPTQYLIYKALFCMWRGGGYNAARGLISWEITRNKEGLYTVRNTVICYQLKSPKKACLDSFVKLSLSIKQKIYRKKDDFKF